MGAYAWGQLTLYLAVLAAAAWPLGHWLARIVSGTLPVWLLRIESRLFRLAGKAVQADMGWKHYAAALLGFSALGVLAVFALQRLQASLPLNPAGMGNVSLDSSINTAVSFVTNTNWQGYAGEATMSHMTQMLALTVQNFLSAACGMAVAFVLVRAFAAWRDKNAASASTAAGLATDQGAGIGNFWVDMTRAVLWVLLPLSLTLALILVGQGVVQNFAAPLQVTSLEPITYEQAKSGADGQALTDTQGAPVVERITTQSQVIALGPVASQEAIKMLGTNGGGFFNANSAHPFENPTPLSNWLQMLAIFLIPAALCFAFGHVVGDIRQGWAVLAAMTLIFVLAVVAVVSAEQQAHPALAALGVDGSAGNMEGKETRFGIAASSLFAVITTAASCGAVNTMHDALTPLGGAVPLLLIQLGEVVFGGVGSGLYGMLIFAMLAVFMAGLMIGRTPEYLGKKIEAREMKWVAVALLITPLLVLGGTALAVLSEAGRAGISNPGAHGFSQMLYALSSAANNNGSAFGGLSANTPFYNYLLAFAMWMGRFGVIVPVLAIAGSLATKQRIEANAGSMPTHRLLFVLLLSSVVLIVGALTYIPALALGPVADHLQLFSAPSAIK